MVYKTPQNSLAEHQIRQDEELKYSCEKDVGTRRDH
jgi:hypothetical protein